MSRVLVLNQNYEPLNVCHVHRAFVLVICGKAEIIELNGHVLRTPSRSYDAPSVIRLCISSSAPIRLPSSPAKRSSCVISTPVSTAVFRLTTLPSTTCFHVTGAASIVGTIWSAPAGPATIARAVACPMRPECVSPASPHNRV